MIPLGLEGPLVTEFLNLLERHQSAPHHHHLGPQLYSFVDRLYRYQQHRRVDQLSALEQALEQLYQEPLQIDGIADLAQQRGLSREHLSRAFRERYGLAPGVWLQRQRLKQVRYLLRETDLSVSEVARLSGFASANVCSRALRQADGLSPEHGGFAIGHPSDERSFAPCDTKRTICIYLPAGSFTPVCWLYDRLYDRREQYGDRHRSGPGLASRQRAGFQLSQTPMRGIA